MAPRKLPNCRRIVFSVGRIAASVHQISAGTFVAMTKAARNAALKRLEAFIGEWRVDASFPGSPPGRVVFEWALDKTFLVERSESPRPAPDSLAIISVHPDTAAYTQHYFDSRGVVRVYGMTFSGGVWILLRNSHDFSPLDFHQRFIGRFSRDGKTITGAWETSNDGSRWEHDFDLKYTRAGRTRRRA
jgi:hypothetical protein